MPSARTEGSELSVGFGILGVWPLGLTPGQVTELFESTLATEKYQLFISEFGENQSLYQRFYDIGVQLRCDYDSLKNVSSVKWTGPDQQAATTSVAKDLFAANTPISVKNESNIVLNPSPHNLFVSVPSGMAPARRSKNWYAETAYLAIQELYSFVKDRCTVTLPDSFGQFEKTAQQSDRKAIQRAIKQLNTEDQDHFADLYVTMCRAVAEESAARFNRHLQHALNSNVRASVLEMIAGHFFRMNAVPYVLAGIDRNSVFAVRIPDLTSRKQNWRLVNIVAMPDLSRRQSVVDFIVTVERKAGGTDRNLGFHAEIRWSHGKFCGNPEGKLYKDFSWVDVPFFDIIL